MSTKTNSNNYKSSLLDPPMTIEVDEDELETNRNTHNDDAKRIPEKVKQQQGRPLGASASEELYDYRKFQTLASAGDTSTIITTVTNNETNTTDANNNTGTNDITLETTIASSATALRCRPLRQAWC